MKKYYYIDPSTNGTSGLGKMAEALIDEAKEKYSYVVCSEDTINEIVGKLQNRAEELNKEHPRWKKPLICFSVNPLSESGLLRIEGWSFSCRKVSAIIAEDSSIKQ